MSDKQTKIKFIQYSLKKLTSESISVTEIKDTYFKLFNQLHNKKTLMIFIYPHIKENN